MQDWLIRVVIIAAGMLIGILASRSLELKFKILSKYIRVKRERTKNLQRHGIIMAILLVLLFSVISVLLAFSVHIEAFLIGLVLGPVQVYFILLKDLEKDIELEEKKRARKERKALGKKKQG